MTPQKAIKAETVGGVRKKHRKMLSKSTAKTCSVEFGKEVN